MKKLIIGLMACILLIGTNLFAADGDLIVNGNVGIGTTSPTGKLGINGHISFESDSNNVSKGLLWRSGSDGSWGQILRDSANGKLYIDSQTGTSLILNGNNTSGNVGIGTVAPTATLDVVGTVSILREPASMNLGTVYTADSDLLFMCNLAGGSFAYITCNSGGVALYSQNTDKSVNQAGCSSFVRKGETYYCTSPSMSGASFSSKVYKLGK